MHERNNSTLQNATVDTWERTGFRGGRSGSVAVLSVIFCCLYEQGLCLANQGVWGVDEAAALLRHVLLSV
jgi:hypothetical protein